MNALEDMLSAELRLKEWLERNKGGPYPGFCHDLDYLLARLNLLRAQNERLKVKAKES